MSSLGLDICEVSVRYGSHEAVKGVSAHLEPGQIVALLGPSGSGKSSLLRAIAGLEPVAGGDILWDGNSVVDVPIHRRGFGLMFQDGQLFPHRSVSGNVAYGLRGFPRAERGERVSEALDLVGMSDYADRSVLSLSGGQAQRVALARSLAPRPSLLLLDEPLSALDRSLREHLSTEIRQILRQSSSTCVYVTHDQDEAFAVADIVGVMIDGRLAAWDTPQNVWSAPGSKDVADFLGFGPFFPAHEGHVAAVPPRALRVRELCSQERASAVSTPAPSVWSDSGSLGEALVLSGRVLEARGARGHTVVELDIDGQRAFAVSHLSPSEFECSSASHAIVSLDPALCPVVSTSR